jgi:hypothetical protein
VVPLPVHTLTPQKISFTAPAAGLVGSKAKLSATGGPSGNPVNFTVDGASRTGVCSVSGTNGTTLTYKAAGSCIIDATQAGNGTYAAAPQIKATIPVGRASKTALSLSSSTATYGKETKLVFTVKVTAKTGKPTGTVQVITGATQLCTATLSKGKATCKLASATTLATGKYKVHAAYSGNTVFAPSVSGAKTLTVK